MNDRNNSPGCERASDLIAFLYNEVDEGEAREFQCHLNQCSICRDEAASFGVVRESIVAWRDEALPHFVPLTVAPQVNKKSAMDALRQFFDLSPLWLKGAAGFAVLALCVLTGWAVFRDKGTGVTSQPGEMYTAQDVDRIVKQALADQQQAQQTATNTEEKAVAVNVEVKRPKAKKSPSSQKIQSGRRPLSRAEREQLAADLRLLAADDDAPLQLLGDRINQ